MPLTREEAIEQLQKLRKHMAAGLKGCVECDARVLVAIELLAEGTTPPACDTCRQWTRYKKDSDWGTCEDGVSREDGQTYALFSCSLYCKRKEAQS